jgi:hypothetical protein
MIRDESGAELSENLEMKTEICGKMKIICGTN